MSVRERTCLRKPMILLALFPLAVLAGEKEFHLPFPEDLVRDARVAKTGKKPLLFLFSVDGCSYCEVIRRHHLLPLSRSESAPVIREVKIGDKRSFVDFNGTSTTHADFAARYNARWAPTIVLVDYRGNRLNDPLVGGDTSGLYGGMLEKAIHEANVQVSRLR